jgi:hypothetical protein
VRAAVRGLGLRVSRGELFRVRAQSDHWGGLEELLTGGPRYY